MVQIPPSHFVDINLKNAVPPHLLLPIIESASLEDNPTIQDTWSGLLASASDRTNELSPSYVEILKQLTPIDARSMKVLYEHFLFFPKMPWEAKSKWPCDDAWP
jgi:Abortive infection alpha